MLKKQHDIDSSFSYTIMFASVWHSFCSLFSFLDITADVFFIHSIHVILLFVAETVPAIFPGADPEVEHSTTCQNK